MTNKPEKIFLQIGCEGDEPNDFKELSGVSWCDEKIHNDDLVYFSEEAILKAGKEGEISMIDVKHLVKILKQ